MPVLMFINLKGGVAKTTNAVAVSEFLAEAGHRVLLVDADHQCTAGELLLGESTLARCEKRRTTLHDLLGEMVKEEFDTETLPNYVVPARFDGDPDERPYLDVLPCSVRIDDFEKNRNKARGQFHSNEEFQTVLRRRTRSLRRWLQAGYDYTIIDCPPSMPIQIQTLLKVADAYIMPTVPDKLSVRGSFYLTERLRRMNVKLPGLGTIWSLYREQNAIHREMIQLAEYERNRTFAWMPPAFETIIPNAHAVARAMESDADSLNARFTYRFAHLYRDLVQEIITRCETLTGTPKAQTALAATT